MLPAGRPSARTLLRAAATAAVLAALTLGLLTYLRPAGGTDPTEEPYAYSLDAWTAALGGDAGFTDATYAALEAAADVNGLDTSLVEEAELTARSVLAADLTGTNRQHWPAYWPPAAPHGPAPVARCTDLRALATSPAVLPVPRHARDETYLKVLIAYAGTCADTVYDDADPAVDYVYLHLTGPEQSTADASGLARAAGTWQPVREWDVPRTRASAAAGAVTEPEPWQLKYLTDCAAENLQARIAVADAFTSMCRAARADGVALQAVSAHRTRSEQAALYAEAVEYYGSDVTARRWVAYADETTCLSRACAGITVSVEPTTPAVTWLSATVACTDAGQVTAATTCPAGTRPVSRAQRYGFTAPAPQLPGYLEFTLVEALGDNTLGAADCAPLAVPVPAMVAAIFRCRLDREQTTGAAAEQVIAEALVVSRCSSEWNATARVFGGRYAHEPNPLDGRRYTHTGVFGIATELADAGWVPGGVEALTDPVANINAAASLYLATGGWEQFACAHGTDPGLQAGPVLPQYGGPQLPDWARQY